MLPLQMETTAWERLFGYHLLTTWEWPLPLTIPKTPPPLCTALLLLASFNFRFILFWLTYSRLAVIFTLEPGKIKLRSADGGSRLPQLSEEPPAVGEP